MLVGEWPTTTPRFSCPISTTCTRRRLVHSSCPVQLVHCNSRRERCCINYHFDCQHEVFCCKFGRLDNQNLQCFSSWVAMNKLHIWTAGMDKFSPNTRSHMSCLILFPYTLNSLPPSIMQKKQLWLAWTQSGCLYTKPSNPCNFGHGRLASSF